MTRKALDRRVARNSASVEGAFLALMHEKDYEAITVDDICRSANVGRSTFYSHYRGKDDLKLRGMEHLRTELQTHQAKSRASSDRTPFSFVLPLFEHAQVHCALYRSLRGGRGCVIALRGLRGMLIELFSAELEASSQPAAAPREFNAHFLTGACLEILLSWLDGGAQQTPAEMANAFVRLAAAAR